MSIMVAKKGRFTDPTIDLSPHAPGEMSFHSHTTSNHLERIPGLQTYLSTKLGPFSLVVHLKIFQNTEQSFED